jgi:hypothetical protein
MTYKCDNTTCGHQIKTEEDLNLKDCFECRPGTYLPYTEPTSDNGAEEAEEIVRHEERLQDLKK